MSGRPEVLRTQRVLDWMHSTIYAQRDEDSRYGRWSTVVEIDEALHAALGCPDQITVTIEAGDLLNEASGVGAGDGHAT